jgi:hypothetical protein
VTFEFSEHAGMHQLIVCQHAQWQALVLEISTGSHQIKYEKYYMTFHQLSQNMTDPFCPNLNGTVYTLTVILKPLSKLTQKNCNETECPHQA